MPKKKKSEGERQGKTGVNKQALASTRGTKLNVYEINKATWDNFYKTPEGKARLRRMKALNDMKMARYRDLMNGAFLARVTDKELRANWNSNQNDYAEQILDGSFNPRNPQPREGFQAQQARTQLRNPNQARGPSGFTSPTGQGITDEEFLQS